MKNKQPTIRQFQLVQALARYQSLSLVAEKLFISQPSVSIQLKNLSERGGWFVPVCKALCTICLR